MGLGHILNIGYLFKCFVELEPSRSSQKESDFQSNKVILV